MKVEYNADTHMSNDFQASDSFDIGVARPNTIGNTEQEQKQKNSG